MTKRSTLVIPDAGPFISLWVADELPLLLKDMRVIVVGAVYDELTRDPANYVKDRDVADFIGSHGETFMIETTRTSRREREDIQKGMSPSRNAGEVAIVDFMSDGLEIIWPLATPLSSSSRMPTCPTCASSGSHLNSICFPRSRC